MSPQPQSGVIPLTQAIDHYFELALYLLVLTGFATLASTGDNAGAIAEYRKVLAAKPGYLAAHFALASLLAKSGDSEGALQELRELSKQEPQNSGVFEQIGDLEVVRKNTTEAKAAYKSALDLAPDRDTRKRISNKLKSLP